MIIELGSKGITANSIHPGYTETDMISSYMQLPGMLEKMASVSPFNRVGTTADLGDAVALFASESARWISGQSIIVAVCFALISCISVFLSCNVHTDSLFCNRERPRIN
jgi:NAD(P)-dependent dehydrogenase (short-subunit alcohol dehydrogenase family)